MTLIFHINQDKDPPEISSPPDDESCETAVRSFIGMSVYTFKSSESPILQGQSVGAIFDLDYNSFYIATEVSWLNSSQFESGFYKSALSGRGFK